MCRCTKSDRNSAEIVRCELGAPSFALFFLSKRQHHMPSKEECQGYLPLNIDRAHVRVLTIALCGSRSRLHGQVCKRVCATPFKHLGTRLSSLFILALAPTAPRLFRAHRQHSLRITLTRITKGEHVHTQLLLFRYLHQQRIAGSGEDHAV